MSSGQVGRGKNKMVAALLAWLTGFVGGQHFYLGSTMAGVVCLLTCGGCGIISLVELVMLLMMSDDDFNKKYNFRTPESMEFVWSKPK
jgi:TM2 domain-containing membrane protein YozV